MSIELPKGVYGVLSNPPDASKIEPFVAKWLVTSGLSPLSILCANLSLSEISVKSNQVIAYLHLFESTDVGSIVNFWNLVDIGLPDDHPNIQLAIELDAIKGISNAEKQRVCKLFEKYDKVFAQDDNDLGKAKGVSHEIVTSDHPPYLSLSNLL